MGVDGGGGLALRAPPAQGSGGLGLRAPHPGHAMPPLPIKEPFANPTRGWQDQADHFLPWCLDEETEAYAPVGGAPEPVAGRQCALGARRRGILGESLCPSCASGGAPSPESVSGVPSTDSVALQDPRACPSPPSPQAAPAACWVLTQISPAPGCAWTSVTHLLRPHCRHPLAVLRPEPLPCGLPDPMANAPPQTGLERQAVPH